MRSRRQQRQRLRSTVLLALLPLVTASAPLRAQACESNDANPGEVERCLLIEQGLRASYESRLDDADAIWQRLRELDPNDPGNALYQVETAWWRVIYDENVTRYDARIEAGIADAIRLAEARLEARPDDPIALYRLGDALVQSARLNGIRGNYLSAGRAGERGRVALERALALRPDLTEIKYPLGLYYYYASVAPSLFKWISWLWFVPSGDRDTGIRHLQEVRDAGGRHSVDAKFVLMNIQTYHGPTDLPAALSAGRALHESYPTNALFHSELIEVLIKIGHYDDAIETALALERSQPIAREAAGRPQLARILRAQATLFAGGTEAAWRLLEDMDPETSELPSWGGAWIILVRGQIHDVRGERSEALAEYARVQSLNGDRHSRRAAQIARSGQARPVALGSYEELPMVGAGPG